MVKFNFRLLLFIFIIFVPGNTTKAQIQPSYENYFYTENEAANLSYCILFDYETVWMKQVSYNDVRNNLAKSSTYYVNGDLWEDKGWEPNYVWGVGWTEAYDRAFKYCPDLSTNTRIVYKRHVQYSWTHPLEGAAYARSGFGCVSTQRLGFMGIGPVRFNYNYDMFVAFSPDKSSFIFWKEKANNIDGLIYDKQTYSLVPTDELLPKSVNYDFLNEDKEDHLKYFGVELGCSLNSFASQIHEELHVEVESESNDVISFWGPSMHYDIFYDYFGSEIFDYDEFDYDDEPFMCYAYANTFGEVDTIVEYINVFIDWEKDLTNVLKAESLLTEFYGNPSDREFLIDPSYSENNEKITEGFLNSKNKYEVTWDIKNTTGEITGTVTLTMLGGTILFNTVGAIQLCMIYKDRSRVIEDIFGL